MSLTTIAVSSVVEGEPTLAELVMTKVQNPPVRGWMLDAGATVLVDQKRSTRFKQKAIETRSRRIGTVNINSQHY